MNKLLTPFTQDGKFLMFAIDHRGSFLKNINPEHPETVTTDEVIEVKKEMLDALREDYSAVLIDPEYGLPALHHKQKPYLLCIEKTGYTDASGERVTELEFTVESLKTMGAAGVKMLVYFHPQAKTAQYQMDLAKKVLEEAHKFDMPLFLEIVTYDIPNANNHKPELVLDSVNMFLEAGVRADVFKLEFPGDPVACFQITKVLKDIPWILLTKGVNYHKFKTQLETAVNGGAKGFLAGRALWQEFSNYPKAQWASFFQNTARARFQEISKVVSHP